MDNKKEKLPVAGRKKKNERQKGFYLFLSYLSFLLILLNVISFSVKVAVPFHTSPVSLAPGMPDLITCNLVFSPVGEGMTSKDSKGKGSTKSSETFRAKIFTWENIKRDIITTTVHIPEKALKEEIKYFGVARGMKNLAYIRKQGLIKIGNQFEVDYSGVYQRNLQYFASIANELTSSAGLLKEQDPLLDFLRFVQYIEYKIPPMFSEGKYIREFYPPLQCLDEKKGDCDTKSILLAELLGTYTGSDEKLGIIILKGYGIFHAVLAIKRNPLPGTLKLYFHGLGYFMPLEPSGPGLMPGFVGRNSYNCLKAGLFRLELLN